MCLIQIDDEQKILAITLYSFVSYLIYTCMYRYFMLFTIDRDIYTNNIIN